MTTQTRQKELVDKAMQCLVLARTINDRYPDITKIPGEHAKKVADLLAEAKRLKGLADLAKQQDDMESWAANPDQVPAALAAEGAAARSEEHTSELQSHHDLVCRLLLEKKKKKTCNNITKNRKINIYQK